jgi:hypothetical protein
MGPSGYHLEQGAVLAMKNVQVRVLLRPPFRLRLLAVYFRNQQLLDLLAADLT